MTGKERREQLLDVGRALFAERGYDGTSVEEVASRAGVSKPVVYEHFGGKEGLYAVVVDREVQRLLDTFTGALTGDKPKLLLEQATLALLTYIEDDSNGFRILVRESPVGLERSGGFATIISDIASQVEHILALTPRCSRPSRSTTPSTGCRSAGSSSSGRCAHRPTTSSP
ncbi:MAG: TetR/AcrR family transcriptional regulator [Actinobacteria bacterium]|nr:TetR/AcrR family transcriptional regulator [Actinomycetota bacterium]